MTSDSRYFPKPIAETKTIPFESAMEMWFWFIQAQEAKNEGARFTAGLSLMPRPCEPTDILKILDRLYRNRRLERDHLLVLRHYGRRQMPPDPRRVKEVRAHGLWKEALERIEPILVRKGIVHEKDPTRKKLTCNRPNKFWSQGAVVYESVQMSGSRL
ncbi:MAG: hypothetical protein AAF988_08745 [Pseudomonadota bacterium]